MRSAPLTVSWQQAYGTCLNGMVPASYRPAESAGAATKRAPSAVTSARSNKTGFVRRGQCLAEAKQLPRRGWATYLALPPPRFFFITFFIESIRPTEYFTP